MGKVMFRCRDMVKTTFYLVPGSTKYVDLGTHLTQLTQDVLNIYIYIQYIYIEMQWQVLNFK